MPPACRSLPKMDRWIRAEIILISRLERHKFARLAPHTPDHSHYWRQNSTAIVCGNLSCHCFAGMMWSQNQTDGIWRQLRRNNDERDDEIGARNTDGFGDAGTHVCDTARGSTSRRTISYVPYDRRDLGDLRSAFRETEVESSVAVVLN